MSIFRRHLSLASSLFRKYDLDYSKVPKIDEKDIQERFVRGSGPGGQAVAKTNNCVVLTHIPTGIVIKCHQSRSLSENRKTARELLVAQWDVQVNGEDSLNAQIRRIDEKRRATQEQKKRKLDALKKAWKEREGIE
ncbi:probable peptide chain release factor C12orf65, mitochondrial isoform X2 [Diaphorina citri]|uniref:Probable peptide chain release factor C12orf65, mitochondrial isoform X1 n=1 Tax=Diaphorina citri TaxID=121845 RepID=A0A1S3CUU9_DIACI|nr:probable peptide chain release factor C12orf65, mitochondrial isoform X1 [Diaphorina citri]XP_017304727.1 probable peptide chain release factor C12orf65, mitochondrial isoform X1 [Diaphorina citri]XP_026676713.1 probable peptide chain release factor C12orf65, mitochondrial isoform X1 [Diaphorina citri]XP_026676714.1 probable peptide chain release factor C12orf65, mitochondrial isoform X2 [Diaphorina citri]